jgi:tRNA modification GTPase
LALLRTVFIPRKPQPRFLSHRLYYGTVINTSRQVLDEALAVYMQAPHTYTREDVVELHCHGSSLVLQEVLRTLFTLGARPAEPGEFTKRAFLAGRIDLTRAEAVIELLQAQTEKSAQLAVHQLQGALFDQLEAIRNELVHILALLEVAIDFPDEDVEIVQHTQVASRLEEAVLLPLQRLLAMADQGRIFREGIKIVLAGRPNVGKSSLLNVLLQEDRALVTPLPGTTRDTIEERFVIRGMPVHLIDTAGIRLHQDPVEAMGIERARKKMQQADLVLFLVDASAEMDRPENELYQSICKKTHIVVLNKSDLVDPQRIAALTHQFPHGPVVSISAKKQQGIQELQDIIYHSVIGEGVDLCEELTCAPNTRHRVILAKTVAACQRLKLAMHDHAPVDLLAVEVQSALDYLGDMTGVTTTDDVLDVVFSQFCIGK